MTTTTTAAHGVRSRVPRAVSLLRDYALPAMGSALAATVWLMVTVAVTEVTGSALLVLVLVALPGAVAMALSRTERACWHEWVLVWLLYVTAMPAYGVMLLIGGYALVGARAWRRHRPRASQVEAD